MEHDHGLQGQGEALLASAEVDQLLKQETETMEQFVPTLGNEPLQPMLIVVLEERDEEGQRQRALLPIQGFEEGADKQQVMRAVGVAVAETGARMVGAILISEAWTKTLSPSESWRMKSETLRPSQTADRQESLVLWLRTIDHRMACAMAPIRRDDAETRLGEWSIQPCQPIREEDQDNLLGFFFLGFLYEWSRRQRES